VSRRSCVNESYTNVLKKIFNKMVTSEVKQRKAVLGLPQRRYDHQKNRSGQVHRGKDTGIPRNSQNLSQQRREERRNAVLGPPRRGHSSVKCQKTQTGQDEWRKSAGSVSWKLTGGWPSSLVQELPRNVNGSGHGMALMHTSGGGNRSRSSQVLESKGRATVPIPGSQNPPQMASNTSLRG